MQSPSLPTAPATGFDRQTYRPEDFGANVVELLACARAAIDADPSDAHRYLNRLTALFHAPHRAEVEDPRLLPAMPGGATGAAAAKGGLAPWQMRRVVGHIARHLAEPVPVATLADLTALSSGHFCRAFKTSVGETKHDFLVRQRIRHAQGLMLSTDDALSQIACACGLTGQAHLTRLFHKLVGTSPRAWHRAVQG